MVLLGRENPLFAKAVAKKLGFSCLDTGAMYRAVAYRALKDGVALDDAERLGALAQDHIISFGHDVGDPVPRIRCILMGKTSLISSEQPEIDKAVSPVSATSQVREALVMQQQTIGAQGNYVVEGRDIGTVVFPEAELKIFLTASPEERAHRRVRQNVDRGIGSINYEEVLADIIRRDEIDSNRTTSPLKPAEDSIHIDSTNEYIEAIIEKIITLAKARMS